MIKIKKLRCLNLLRFTPLLFLTVFLNTPSYSFTTVYEYSFNAIDMGIKDDTITYDNGDTVTIYTSGQDTTFLIYYEESEDTLYENAWTVPSNQTIQIVTLSHHDFAVNQGVLGLNLSDFFEPDHAGIDDLPIYIDTEVPNPWQAVADLAPKTVRSFSGAGGKFMHPLGYTVDDEDDPNDGRTYGGYGFYWKELIKYYDWTDGVLTIDLASEIAAIVTDYASADPLVGDCDGCSGWMDSRFIDDFTDFYFKWQAQPFTTGTLDPEDLYINQLIDLIEFIESENVETGLEVEVIYCVNILSQTATEMLDVIDYLTTNGIDVVGIELGNEVYFDFQQLSMGFESFGHYWNYINRGTYSTTDGFEEGEEEDLLAVLPTNVANDHDFIFAIKGDDTYRDIKIGLPAQNTPNCGAEYDFPLTPPGFERGTPIPVITEGEGADPCGCNYPNWNVDMVAEYDAMVDVPNNTQDEYAFDAVIFHTYYGPTNNTGSCLENSNWRDIILDNLHPNFDPGDLESEITSYVYTDGDWTYSTEDTRLDDAFSGIAGRHFPDNDDPLLAGNYTDFTRERLDISYEEHANQMNFTSADTGPETKEVWITEYNLDDKISLPDGDYQQANLDELEPYAAAATNSFAHAVLIQNWFLWHLKANYDNDYKDNFLTYTTIQNALSAGSTVGLLTKSDKADLVELEVITSCGDPNLSPFYLRKATYYSTQLWRVILDNDLDYLKSNTDMSIYNNNIAPTVFIDKTNQDLYVFYSNISNSAQLFAFDPGTLVNDYGGAEVSEVELGTDAITSLILDADQLYSTSGLTPMYLFNSGYNTCTSSETSENRFELTQLETYSPTGTCPGAFETAVPEGVCLNMPAVSMGYFRIPYSVTEVERLGALDNSFAIYPNPNSNYFMIINLNKGLIINPEYKVELYSMTGNLVLETTFLEGRSINIESLPVGVYNVLIYTNNELSGSETLVKMQ